MAARAASVAGEVEQVFLREGEVGVDLGDVGDGGERSAAGRCQRTLTAGDRAHDAVGGSLDDAVAQIFLGRSQGSLGGGDGTAGDVHVVDSHVVLTARDDILVMKHAGVALGSHGRSQGSLGGDNLLTGALDGGLVLDRVDGEQRLAARNTLTLVDVHLGDEAADHGTHVHVAAALDDGRIIAVELAGGILNGLYLQFGNLLLGCGGILLAA